MAQLDDGRQSCERAARLQADPPPVPARQSATETKFTARFEAVLASVAIEAIQTPVASPRANAFAERFVRTVREDCLH